MKKVLYVSNRTGFSGAEVVLLRLIQNNKNVLPVVMAPESLMAKKFQDIGVKVHVTSFFKQTNRKHGNKLWIFQILLNQLLGSLELTLIIIKERPDIVHANGLGAAIYASFPSKLLGRPFIWTDHDVFNRGSLEAVWASRVSRFSDRIVSVSKYVGQNLIDLGVPKNKVITIYNGLDVDFFDPEKADGGPIREALRIPKETRIVSLFALVTHWKGHHVVINAAKELVDHKVKNFAIVFVGATDDTRYKTEMDKKIIAFGLEKVVHFLGFVPNVRDAYKDTDVILNSSIKPEPFGTTIYEAMAMGKLVIAADIGGNPEIVTDGKTGFLVPPSKPDELAAKIDYVLNNFQKLSPIRQNARKKVTSELNLTQMINSYNDLYRNL
jgi:glycosyltransferase involved in cell wall biosynthesis